MQNLKLLYLLNIYIKRLKVQFQGKEMINISKYDQPGKDKIKPYLLRLIS